MEVTKEKMTFRPLSRGRYRCNQTGEITKNCEAYRRTTHKKVQVQKTDKLPRASMALDEEWICPECNRKNYSGKLSKINICTRCSEKVVINKQLNHYIY